MFPYYATAEDKETPGKSARLSRLPLKNLPFPFHPFRQHPNLTTADGCQYIAHPVVISYFRMFIMYRIIPGLGCPKFQLIDQCLIIRNNHPATRGMPIVPMLPRGNAACDAPASRNAGAFPDELPRRPWEPCNRVPKGKYVYFP